MYNTLIKLTILNSLIKILRYVGILRFLFHRNNKIRFYAPWCILQNATYDTSNPDGNGNNNNINNKKKEE